METKRDLRLRQRAAMLSLVLAPLLATCAPTIAQFSATAYEQATALKVDALSLMGKATEPYAKHHEEVAALTLRLAKAHEFAKGRPKNEISAQQWAILTDSSRHLLGGFLARWKRDSTLTPTFVTEAGGQVAKAFDTIIGLESGKLKPDQVR
jgi:hypothetical protein